MHGIIIIEIYSYNKRVNMLYTVVASPSYIPPKCAKTREPKDEHCISWCTHISYNVCDPIPLDNLNKPHSTTMHNNIPLLGNSLLSKLSSAPTNCFAVSSMKNPSFHSIILRKISWALNSTTLTTKSSFSIFLIGRLISLLKSFI